MRTFSLDMIPGGAQTAVACNQYEAGDTWVFALYYDGGRYEIPTGAEVSITGTKPDGAAYKVAGTVVSNSVQIVVTDQITACAGRSIAEILVESETDGTTLYSANFPLLIEPAAVQGEFNPSEIPSAIVDTDGNVYYSAEYIPEISGGVPSEVRQVILTLFQKAAYDDEDGVEDELAVVQAWAEATTAITVSPASASVSSASPTAQLSAVTTPAGGAVTWSSSNTAVATVSSTGLVTAVGNGVATITATSGNVSASCAVTVTGFRTLTGIEAVYTQSGTVTDTDTLDNLKSDLVVTASYDDSTMETITNYALSGTLAEGTSTITVSYGGMTDTFTVTVIHSDLPSGYTQYDYLKRNVDWGTQVRAYGILTDAQISTEDTVEAKLYIPSGLGSDLSANPLFGTRTGASGAKEFALFVRYNDTRLGYWYDGTDTSTTNIYASKDVVNTIKFQPVGASTAYPDNVTINVNGDDKNTGSTSTGKTFNPWFGIFTYAISATGITGNNVYHRGELMGEIKVTDSNNALKYHFIPASYQGIYGFYEKVNGKFFYNETYGESGYTGGSWPTT